MIHARRKDRLFIGLLFVGLLLVVMRCAFAEEADLAIVLSVDVSGSVNEERFHLQREGIAQALESPAMVAAVTAERQVIEVAIVEWAEDAAVLQGWTILRGREDLGEVSAELRDAPRPSLHTMTNVGLGMQSAVALFRTMPLLAHRMVIDVSGDGEQNCCGTAPREWVLPAAIVRNVAVARGITVNGLPITSGDEPKVDKWYAENVVGGDQAVLIVANGFGNFAVAMRQKLALEIAAVPETRFAAP